MRLFLSAMFMIANARSGLESTSANCPPTNYTAVTGIIFSPNYPQNYDNNEDCVYIIYAPQDYHVEIKFIEFNTESCCDYLFIYKGLITSGVNLVARLEGVAPLGQTYSTDDVNIMLLRFESDSTNTDPGFLGQYTAVLNAPTTTTPSTNGCPPSTYSSSSGTIQSPNYPNNYPNNAQCSYLITVPSGTVSLTFAVFHTEDCCDFLFLYDGADQSARLIAKLSGTSPAGNTYWSTQRQMYALFVSDISTTFQGFSAHYQAGP